MTGPAGRRSGRVVVVGCVGVALAAVVDRAPAPGETVLARSVVRYPAGAAFNTAVAAARAGVDVSIVGRVGHDAAGQACLTDMGLHGIGTSAVAATPGAVTGAVVALRAAAGGASQGVVVVPGANELLSSHDVRGGTSSLAPGDVLAVSWESAPRIVEQCVEAAHRSGARLLLGPGPDPDRGFGGATLSGLSTGALSVADPLVMTGSEAAALTADAAGSGTARWAAGGWAAADPRSRQRLLTELLALGPRSVAVTLGERGALWADRHRTVLMPSVTVPVVDSSGVGAAFAGTVAAGMAMGHGTRQVLARSAAAAAASLSHPGAQPWRM